MNKEKLFNILKTILKAVPMIAVVLFALFILRRRDNITVDSVLGYAPESPLLAVAFIIVLYIIKSISVFFPLIVIKITAGVIFPLHVALIVNCIGIMISFVIPYCIGRRSKKDLPTVLSKKHPKLAEIIVPNKNRQFFMCFILRSIYFLPSDIVSMFLGALKIPAHKYLLGGLLGSLPSTITCTLIGANIDNTSSPVLWISAGLTLFFSLISYIIYNIYRKKKHSD
ncbi:MAG: TVP38/TMEM64 family protein [Oscillospiraceae bacterium]|nr:TVP38/TMEM64 family protein [Oscillospiraceae bacterium]